MSIQEDVMHAIGSGGCARKDLRARTGGYSQDELDCAVNALLRARRVSESFGKLELLPSKRAMGDLPHTGRRPASVVTPADVADLPAKLIAQLSPEGQAVAKSLPPTAAEEAAASLQPAKRTCDRCGRSKELNAENFSRNRHGFMLICKACYGASVSAGHKGKLLPMPDKTVAALTRIATVETNTVPAAVSPEDSARAEPAGSRELSPTQNSKDIPREGDNRDVSAERCRSTAAVLGTPGSYSRSDLSEDVQTPAGSGIASPALSNARAQRQAALNRIAALEVELANERGRVERCERFIEMWKEFEKGEAA